ncbi:MAG: cytochrome c1 [Methylobacillus sp.]|jgi:ubiquinol-cytochrome c reductase cytochrome c1 subunit|nr:cytochrome c1 [Methylobacillus sp.]
MNKLLLKLCLLLPIVAILSPLYVAWYYPKDEVHLDKAPINSSDQASLQRGAKYFVNYCLNCHSAQAMRYNRLTEIGLTEDEIKANLMFPAEKIGQTMQVGMKPADAKAWFGVAPPDLSVEERVRGADWLYTYLRGFYHDETRPSGWNNTLFPNVAMPHVLWELQGEQQLKITKTKGADGTETETRELTLVKQGTMTPGEYDTMVADLVNYLAFMAEPGKATRHNIGYMALLALFLLFLLAYALKKEFWKDVH